MYIFTNQQELAEIENKQAEGGGNTAQYIKKGSKTMKFTEKEQTALLNIIESCIDLYNTSSGKIDCAEFGQESLDILNGIKDKLTQ